MTNVVQKRILQIAVSQVRDVTPGINTTANPQYIYSNDEGENMAGNQWTKGILQKQKQYGNL